MSNIPVEINRTIEINGGRHLVLGQVVFSTSNYGKVGETDWLEFIHADLTFIPLHFRTGEPVEADSWERETDNWNEVDAFLDLDVIRQEQTELVR